jgi:uncharacterized Zn finger protein
MKKEEKSQICPICGRNTPEKHIEKHHLVPKAKGGKDTILVCRNCGDFLHKLFTNNQLRDNFNTLEKILYNESIQTWIKWVQKRETFNICMKEKKKKK